MKENDILQAQDVRFRYDTEQPNFAVDGVSMEVHRGEFVAVLGANGCGKSTLAKHFNAILLPESGTVLVEDMDTRTDEKLYDIRQRVGMVFQWWKRTLPLRWKTLACPPGKCAPAWMTP